MGHHPHPNNRLVLLILAALMIIAIASTLRAGDRVRCWQESPYANTLQHDIHRRWVCKDDAPHDDASTPR